MTKYFILFLIGLAACKSQGKPDTGLQPALVSLIKSKPGPEEIKACVVIPRAGCTGCIQGTLLYCKDNIAAIRHVKVILTDMSDRRLVQIQMGKEFLANNNVVLDSANSLKPFFDSPYPRIYYFDQDMKITNESVFDYQKNDLTKIR